MITIQNTRELPRDLLYCFALTDEQAKAIATQYQASWYYPCDKKSGYLYVLNSEHEEKKAT